MVLELSLTRSWVGPSKLRRGQPRAQVKTGRKIAAALKVDPSEIAEVEDDEA